MPGHAQLAPYSVALLGWIVAGLIKVPPTLLARADEVIE
jgi:hypothetical protein